MALARIDAPVQLVFSGECIDGHDPLAVRRAVGAALKLDERRAARLFSGKQIVMKRNADAAYALRQVARFAMMGAVLRAQPMPPLAAPVPTPPMLLRVEDRARRLLPRRLAVSAIGAAGLMTVLGGALLLGSRLSELHTDALALALVLAPVATPATPVTEPPVVPPTGTFTSQPSPALAVAPGPAVEDDLINRLSAQVASDYKQRYLPAGLHKAFAISEGGAHAWVVDAASENQARESALALCMQAPRSAESSCRVVDADGQQQE